MPQYNKTMLMGCRFVCFEECFKTRCNLLLPNSWDLYVPNGHKNVHKHPGFDILLLEEEGANLTSPQKRVEMMTGAMG
jgi:hypothetical protein